MSANGLWFEESGDELRNDEYPEGDCDESLGETIACPNCGDEIYEDTPQCPHCREYILDENNVLSAGPPWLIILGFLGALAAMLLLLYYAR